MNEATERRSDVKWRLTTSGRRWTSPVSPHPISLLAFTGDVRPGSHERPNTRHRVSTQCIHQGNALDVTRADSDRLVVFLQSSKQPPELSQLKWSGRRSQRSIQRLGL